jgi:hypothetical protein
VLHTTPKIGPLHPGAGASAGGVRLRAYRAGDRAAVRRICADTGFLGQPTRSGFRGPRAVCQLLTDCYTRLEADALLVSEVSGEVRGYLGCSSTAGGKSRWRRNRAIDEQQAWSLIGQAEELLGSVSDP